MKQVLFISLLLLSFCSYSQINDPFTDIPDSIETTKSNWIYATTNDLNENYYLKSSCVSSQMGVVEVWVKLIKKKFIHNKRTYSNVKTLTLYRFYCNSKEYAILQIAQYASGGKQLTSETFTPETQHVIPDTVAEDLLDKACEMF